jgi:dihydroorotase
VLLALQQALDRGRIADSDITQEKLEGFLSRFGRKFYKLPDPSQSGKKIILERKGEKIPTSIKTADNSLEVALSLPGSEVFSLRWT